MKIFLYLIAFFTVIVEAQTNSALEEVRNAFPFFNSESQIDKYLNHLEDNNTDLGMVYKGALNLYKSKFAVFPHNKYKYFKKGRNQIETAVKNNPNSLEIRSIRLIFQYELPHFLRYFEQKEIDFQFFTTNYYTSSTSKDIKQKMLYLLKNLKKLEPEKLQKLKQLS